MDHDVSDAIVIWTGFKERATPAAVAEFRKRHPEVSDDAAAALAWCFTYDWK